MGELDYIYFRKDDNRSDYYYKLLDKVSNVYIFREVDSITDECNIISLYEDDFNKYLYSSLDFFKDSMFINKIGYYKDMFDIEKYLYESFVLLYKDDYNEMLYDSFLDKVIIRRSIYNLEDFVCVSNNTDYDVLNVKKLLKY